MPGCCRNSCRGNGREYLRMSGGGGKTSVARDAQGCEGWPGLFVSPCCQNLAYFGQLSLTRPSIIVLTSCGIDRVPVSGVRDEHLLLRKLRRPHTGGGYRVRRGIAIPGKWLPLFGMRCEEDPSNDCPPGQRAFAQCDVGHPQAVRQDTRGAGTADNRMGPAFRLRSGHGRCRRSGSVRPCAPGLQRKQVPCRQERRNTQACCRFPFERAIGVRISGTRLERRSAADAPGSRPQVAREGGFAA